MVVITQISVIAWIVRILEFFKIISEYIPGEVFYIVLPIVIKTKSLDLTPLRKRKKDIWIKIF